MFVSQMMGGRGSGGRSIRGQEVRGLFSDPWSSALEQDAELQIISNVASPGCCLILHVWNWIYLKLLTNLIVNDLDLTLHCWCVGIKCVFQSLCQYMWLQHVRISHPVMGWLSPWIHKVTEGDGEGNKRWRLKGNKKSKRVEGGDFYLLSSMIDVRSIVEGKGRREGAEKSIREEEA